MDYDTNYTVESVSNCTEDGSEEFTPGFQPTTIGSQDDYLEYLKRVNENVNKYYPIALIIVACLGNSISFAVYSRKTFSKSVTGFYFRCLAICDTFTILLGMIPKILLAHFGIYYAISDLSCGVVNFLRISTYDYSIYILILVTVERFIGVWYPHKAKVIYTKKNAFVSVAITGFITYARNIYYLFTLKYVEYFPGDYVCYFKDEYVKFYTTIEPFIPIALSSLIPFAIMLFLNVAIALRVFKAQRQRAAMSSVAGNSNAKQGTTGLTIVLMTVAFTFLILSIPDLIKLIQLNILLVIATNETGLKAVQLSLWYDLSGYIAATNNAINFFLYCLSGPAFRRELAVIFARK